MGQPLYYKGYSGKCDAAGSAKRAAEFNARAADVTPGRNTPQVVTGLGCIGQVGLSAVRLSSAKHARLCAPCQLLTGSCGFVDNWQT
jgi:hypothetical protein